jgi:hypothetical protein
MSSSHSVWASTMSMPRLSISVDLEPQGPAAVGFSSRESLESTARRLIDLMSGPRRGVTWVADDPASSKAIGWAFEANCRHEAALLFATDWSGEENGRSRFAAEILRRKRAAEQAGIRLTTLATHGAVPREHFEFLVRQGISAIRSVEPLIAKRSTNFAVAGGVVSLRYGLWQIAGALRWSGGSWFAEQLNVRRICRAIDRSIATGISAHLVIDAPQLAMRSRAAFNSLSKILRHIERRQGDGLQVGSIAETIAALMPSRAARSAQSVLRAA